MPRFIVTGAHLDTGEEFQRTMTATDERQARQWLHENRIAVMSVQPSHDLDLTAGGPAHDRANTGQEAINAAMLKELRELRKQHKKVHGFSIVRVAALFLVVVLILSFFVL